jgi:hypothetical protein
MGLGKEIKIGDTFRFFWNESPCKIIDFSDGSLDISQKMEKNGK